MTATMELEAVRSFWPTLLRHQESLSLSAELPLVGLRGLEPTFELAALDADPGLPQSGDVEPGAYPKFSRVSQSSIAGLRRLIQSRSSSERPGEWAERLLRFCELRLPTLQRRSLEAHGDPENVRSLYGQIVALLLDRYRVCGDLRLLNTVLKLADLPWTRSTLSPAAEDDKLVSAALCARNRLLTAQALRELEAR